LIEVKAYTWTPMLTTIYKLYVKNVYGFSLLQSLLGHKAPFHSLVIAVHEVYYDFVNTVFV